MFTVPQGLLSLHPSTLSGEGKRIKDYKNLHLLPKNAVVLSTGDPMFSGLGKFAGEGDRIVPGISSIQIACARTGVDMSSLAIITAHGRDPAPAKKEFLEQVNLGKNIFLLPADTFGSTEVAAILKDKGIEADIYVCENFGYPEERIVLGTINNPPVAESSLHCVVVVF